MADNKIVNGVWKGPRLTRMQQLCIKSFQQNDHEFHLYVHNDVEGIPEGTKIHRIEEVAPVIPPFKFDANMSDFTRIKIVYAVGGFYVDLDTVCLRHFDFKEDYAFVSESKLGSMKQITEPTTQPSREVQEYLSGCIFKAPAKDPMLHWIADQIQRTDTMNPKNWIQYGPEMVQRAIPRFKLLEYVHPPSVFDALPYNEFEHLVVGGIKWPEPYPESVAYHLRSSFWDNPQHPTLRSDGIYPPDSMYEILKKKYGVSND